MVRLAPSSPFPSSQPFPPHTHKAHSSSTTSLQTAISTLEQAYTLHSTLHYTLHLTTPPSSTATPHYTSPHYTTLYTPTTSTAIPAIRLPRVFQVTGRISVTSHQPRCQVLRTPSQTSSRTRHHHTQPAPSIRTFPAARSWSSNLGTASAAASSRRWMRAWSRILWRRIPRPSHRFQISSASTKRPWNRSTNAREPPEQSSPAANLHVASRSSSATSRPPSTNLPAS